MRTLSSLHIFLLVASIALLAVAGCKSTPSDPQLVYHDAWARTSPMSAANGAVYLVIENKGSEADRLIGVSSPAAETVELHESYEENGVMKMRPLEGGLQVPAKGQVELKPGGYHVMLINLLQALEVGNTISVTLTFEKSGEVTLEAKIQDM